MNASSGYRHFSCTDVPARDCVFSSLGNSAARRFLLLRNHDVLLQSRWTASKFIARIRSSRPLIALSMRIAIDRAPGRVRFAILSSAGTGDGEKEAFHPGYSRACTPTGGRRGWWFAVGICGSKVGACSRCSCAGFGGCRRACIRSSGFEACSESRAGRRAEIDQRHSCRRACSGSRRETGSSSFRRRTEIDRRKARGRACPGSRGCKTGDGSCICRGRTRCSKTGSTCKTSWRSSLCRGDVAGGSRRQDWRRH